MKRTFNSNYNKVYSACKQALEDLDMSVEYNNKQKGAISASTSSSIFSWGETVDIKISDKDSGKTVVEVESNAKAQLIDWGKNEKNEQKILDRIEDILAK